MMFLLLHLLLLAPPLLLLALLSARPAAAHRPYSLYVWGQAFQPDKCGTSPNGAYVSWRDERNWDAGCFARPYDTPAQRSALFDALGGLGDGREVSKLFLSVAGTPHTGERGKIEDIADRARAETPREACPEDLMIAVAEARLRGVRVYALFGNECHDLCEKDKVRDVVAYNEICSGVARDDIVRFDGAAINNEFLSEAKECGGRTDVDPDPEVRDWRSNEEIWRGLLDGLRLAKQRLEGLPLHFSLGHAWDYCDDGAEREIEWGGQTKMVVHHMMDQVDSVDIQVAWAYLSDDRAPADQTLVERARSYHDYWFGTLGRVYDEDDPNFFVLAYANPTGSKYKFIFEEFKKSCLTDAGGSRGSGCQWNDHVWTPLVRVPDGYVMTGNQADGVRDGYEALLSFPKNVGRGEQTRGPSKATVLQSNELIKRGDFEARLVTARGRTEDEGIVSSFFVGHFEDCEDGVDFCHPDEDGNGIPDQHEIDFEFQNSARSVVYLTVWRDRGPYPVMRKRTARINIAEGSVIENLHEGTDELDVANEYDLGWSDPAYDHSLWFYTYSFEWRKDRVTFFIDLEDGEGRRRLFEVLSEENVPTIPLMTYANVWHTHADWYPHNFEATEVTRKIHMRVDYIKAVPSSTSDCQTSFAPHSSGAFETHTSCFGSRHEWDLDRTQQGMFDAFDVVEQGLEFAAGGIHYYGGLFNTGITEGWPVNKQTQYPNDLCSQHADCAFQTSCNPVDDGRYAEKRCAKLSLPTIKPPKVCLPKGFECRSNNECCKGLVCPECTGIFCKYGRKCSS